MRWMLFLLPSNHNGVYVKIGFGCFVVHFKQLNVFKIAFN